MSDYTHYLCITDGHSFQRDRDDEQAIMGAARRACYIKTDVPFAFVLYRCGPTATVNNWGNILTATKDEAPPVLRRKGKLVRRDNPDADIDLSDAERVARFGLCIYGEPKHPEPYLYQIVEVSCEDEEAEVA